MVDTTDKSKGLILWGEGKKIDKPLPKVYHTRSNFKIQNTDILVCFQLLKYWCTLYVHDFKDQLADCPPWLSHHYPAMAYAPKFLSPVHPFFPTRFLQLCTFKGESALWSWSLFLMRGKIRCRAEQGHLQVVDLQTPGAALKEWPESPFSYVLKLGLSKTE